MNCLRKIFCKIYSGISGNSFLSPEIEASGIQGNEDVYKGRGVPSSELIFRSDYFRIIGNDQLRDAAISGPWYAERIVSYTEKTRDPNMISPLRKIASGNSVDEALRHRAAGILNMLEERKTPSGIIIGPGAAKRLNAMILLSGSRTPQTTEILRLLRDKSTSSKRYAILMIGKFRLADLAGEVCDCLPVPALSRVAADVLQNFGGDASEELIRLFMNLSGNRETGRIIVTLLGKTCSKSNDEFIFSLLWSNTREIRFIAAEQLRKNRFTCSGERSVKINRLISEAIGVITWNLAARESADKIRKTSLVKILDDEISEWKSFIVNLMSLCADRSAVEAIEKNYMKTSRATFCYVIYLIDKHCDESVKEGLIDLFGNISPNSQFRKLKKKWPAPVNLSENLAEDIINRDYNLINNWTKASALRNMEIADNGSAAESVRALLFSPVRLLREEAAMAMNRSGISLPEDLASRLPGEINHNIREIIAGNVKRYDLSWFRVTFLAGLFPGIPPGELIILAGSLNYYRNNEHPEESLADSVVWEIDENLAVKSCMIIIDENNKKTLLQAGGGEWFILSLDALDNFLLVIPGRAAEIYDYFDKNATVSVND
jgi:hypothetical protein